jgi:hypothetical protein
MGLFFRAAREFVWAHYNGQLAGGHLMVVYIDSPSRDSGKLPISENALAITQASVIILLETTRESSDAVRQIAGAL